MAAAVSNPHGISKPQLRLIKQKVRTSFNAGDNNKKTYLNNEYDNRSEYISSTNQRPQPPNQPRRGGDHSPARSILNGPTMSDISNNGRSSKKYNKSDNPIVTSAAAIGNENVLPTIRRRNSGMQRDNSEKIIGNDPSYTGNMSNKDTTSSCSISGNNSDNLSKKLEYIPSEIGLDNLGNTCFMNSALQCLLHVEPLVLFFLQPGNIDNNLNLASPKKGVLASSFYHLIKEIYQKRSKLSLSPIHLHKAVSKYAPYLMDYQQEDSQEFLRFLLDGMSEDLCRKYSDIENNQLNNNNCNKNSNRKSAAQRLRDETKVWKDVSSNQEEPIVEPTSTEIAEGPGSGSKIATRLHRDIKRGSRFADAREDNNNDSNKLRSSTADTSSDSRDILNDFSNENSSITRNSATAPPHSNEDNNTKGDNNKEPKSIHDQANDSWNKYLKLNNSIITDIFAGQLQSTIECLTCHARSSTFDPFLDLSLPISSNKNNNSRRNFLGTLRNPPSIPNDNNSNNKITLEHCFANFTSDEVLDGDDMITCEKCKQKRKCIKKLSIYKYPKYLVVHIKRFRFNAFKREKLSTDVKIPINNLDLSEFLSADVKEISPESPISNSGPIYDLVSVCNHHGNLHGGHYIAHIKTNSSNNSQWLCFNDSRVSPANPASAIGPSAYVLFYKLRN